MSIKYCICGKVGKHICRYFATDSLHEEQDLRTDALDGDRGGSGIAISSKTSPPAPLPPKSAKERFYEGE